MINFEFPTHTKECNGLLNRKTGFYRSFQSSYIRIQRGIKFGTAKPIVFIDFLRC